MDLEALRRELQGKQALKDAADSPEGRKLAETLDADAVATAAKRGDMAALKDILGQVLSTPEGKALAQKVQKAVGQK